MNKFKPCQGKMACRDNDNGTHCLTCGRSFQEITCLRELLAQLTALAIDYDYENISEYTGYIARKLEKSISYQQQLSEEKDL